MDIAAETLQAFAEDAWDILPETANNYRPQLRLYEQQLTKLFSQSGSISSVSKNSTSQSYRGPGVGSYTIAQLQSAWRMLINLYDTDKLQTDQAYYLSQKYPNNPQGQAFIAAYPNYAQDPDPAVYDLMKVDLYPINEYECDLTVLRLKPTLSAQPVLTW